MLQNGEINKKQIMKIRKNPYEEIKIYLMADAVML